MASSLEKFGWNDFICHTNFSFLVGASHPDELVRSAATHGYRSLGITDFDGVYGLARAYRAMAPLQAEGLGHQLKLVFGAEFHLCRDHHEPTILQDTVVLIAQSALGYHHLCKLASYSHRGGKLQPHVPLEDLLAADVRDLALIIPMRGLIHRLPTAAICARVAALKAHFKGRTYLAITRHLNRAEDQAILPTIELGRLLEVPWVLSQDAFFHEPSQKDLSDLLHAIRLNRPLSALHGHLFVNASRSLHSLKSIEERYRPLPIYLEALKAAHELAASIDFSLKELRYHYPKEMLPAGVGAQEYLVGIVWAAAAKHYGDVPDKIVKLLEHEIQLISLLNFADYFLTVWDIVTWARGQKILCQGRGSAANSAVCFILGITPLDPNAFDVLFERFISVERGDPPDIDVDFEHERREEVIQYIYRRYGRAKAAMVANVITFRSKGAIRATGKALGIPLEHLEEASQLLATKAYRSTPSTQAVAAVRAGVCTEVSAVRWDLWASLSTRLKGFPRHLGIHSGGFMLADRELDHLVAQEPATMAGRSVIQWCKDDIEALGFFKIDILALGILTALRKCLSLVQSHYRRDLNLVNLPKDDPRTYDMICRAETAGTFQIESRAQMSMLPRLRPRCLYDLVIEVAIIRPGPIQGKMVHPYLRRRSGEEAIDFPDERLRPILERTLGIPIFQEQVMRIAMAVGGFTPGEADELRKNIGAFSLRGKVEKWIAKLQSGMKHNGLSDAFIETITQQLHGFAHYGFPESHAGSFALLAYASCYLKCYYPAAFFTSLLNSQPMGFYTPHTLLQTVMAAGVKVLKVCVAKSEWDTTLEIVPGDKKYAVRLGLSFVRSLRQEGALDMLRRRSAAGGWHSLEQVVKGGCLSRGDFTALAAADAFHLFGVDRRSAIWLAEAAPFCQHLEDVHESVAFAEESASERAQADFHATSTTLGLHPAEIIKDEAWCYGVKVAQITSAKQLAAVRSGERVTVFGMTIVRQAPPSANGMVFITLEDGSGLINVAITPQFYQRYHLQFDGEAWLCVRGVLQRQNTAHSLLVEKIFAKEVRVAEVVPLDGYQRTEQQGLDVWGSNIDLSRLSRSYM